MKWYEKITTLLLAQGYSQAHSNHSLFTKHSSSSFTALVVYTDHIHVQCLPAQMINN